ncbi:MAG: GNAT family N-acetyltransferase [Gemmatimonadaceae bacterium]
MTGADEDFRIDDAVSDADEATVRRGLLAFNEQHIGPSDERPVRLVARDATGGVVAGLLGHTRWGWLHVEKLWVAKDARGHGLGSRLMADAESLAIDRGCSGAMLHTFEHQARSFYEKLGYVLFGTLEGYPAGTRQFYLCKRLQPTTNSLASGGS